MRHMWVAAFAVSIALAACGEKNPVSPLRSAELRRAPLSITVDGVDVVLTSYLWRDFQPTSPPDGKGLAVSVHVGITDGSPIPSTITADAVWVVYGGQVWAASLEEVSLASPMPSYYEAVARDGPKWGPAVAVDVIARVHDSKGATWLLRAASQTINRTD